MLTASPADFALDCGFAVSSSELVVRGSSPGRSFAFRFDLSLAATDDKQMPGWFQWVDHPIL